MGKFGKECLEGFFLKFLGKEKILFLDCPEGQFGQNCKQQCECYNGARCNPIDGKCQCLPGYLGPNCKLELRGFFF